MQRRDSSESKVQTCNFRSISSKLGSNPTEYEKVLCYVEKVKNIDSKTTSGRKNQYVIVKDCYSAHKLFLNCKYPSIDLKQKTWYKVDVRAYAQSPYKQMYFINNFEQVYSEVPVSTTDIHNQTKIRSEIVPKLKLSIVKVSNPYTQVALGTDLDFDADQIDYSKDLLVTLRCELNNTYYLRVWATDTNVDITNFRNGANVMLLNYACSKNADNKSEADRQFQVYNLSSNMFSETLFLP